MLCLLVRECIMECYDPISKETLIGMCNVGML